MKQRTKSQAFLNISMGILLVVIVCYLIFLAVKSIFPDEQETIKFEVIGITNSTDASTLVQLHFECIKFCVNQMSDGTTGQDSCFAECAKLGGECNLK